MKPIAISYIRFSTPEQEKGDSYNRQLEESNAIAKKFGFISDEPLTDRGLSALTGDHRKKGKFKMFLEMIENGEIPKGSILIVENLDRLSREPGFDAMKQLTDILDADIRIIISQDIENIKELSRETINKNPFLLGEISGEITRANRESARKQDTLSKAWNSKRKRIADGIKLSKKCPAWLKPVSSEPDIYGNKEVIDFEPIEEAVRVINLIFDMYIEGKGKDRIAKELNQTDFWTPSSRMNRKTGEYRKSIWRGSYISKLLHGDRRLIGEFEPRHKLNGKYVGVGEVFTKYYPAIIDEKKYLAVQALVKQKAEKAGNIGGRNDKMNNLFSPLAICIKCGAPMAIKNAGQNNGGNFYRCRDAKNGLGCNESGKKYKIIEDTILLYCVDLDVKDIVSSNKKRISSISKLNKQKQEISNKIEDHKNSLRNLLEQAQIADNPEWREMVNNKASIHIEHVKTLQQDRNIILDKLDDLKHIEKDTQKQLKDVRELLGKMTQMTGENRIELRLKLRAQLRQLIRQIKIGDQAAIIFFKSGEQRMVRYDDPKEDYKYWDMAPAKDVELAKAGKLPNEVGPGLYRTKYPKKSK